MPHVSTQFGNPISYESDSTQDEADDTALYME